ncbi:MAG: hypothetical protein R6U86_10850 [Bacteroidales bacterium]
MTNKMISMLAASFFLTILFPCSALALNITETSAAIGKDCVAGEDYNTAMGYQSAAVGWASTAMGYGTAAAGVSSTAMGEHSSAVGDYSTAIGYAAYASYNCANAIGYYVRADAEYATIIGCGADASNRLSNNVPSSFAVGYRSGASDATPEFLVRDGGVGINTTSPSTSLHVQKNISGGASMANHVAAIENTSEVAGPDVLMLKVNIEAPGNGCNFITFRDSERNLGSIEGNGSGGIQLNTSGGDFAEYLPKAKPDETLAPGDIVGLFPEGLSKKTDLAQRIMVITTAPAVLGNMPRTKDVSLYAAAAFLGQVPVRVEGNVSAGDFITPSGRADGTGVAVSPQEISIAQYSSIVGRALESSMQEDVKTVNVLVGLPENGLWDAEMDVADSQMHSLENRIAALEARARNSFDKGFLPGAGIVMGSVGLFWMNRRRKTSQTRGKAD